MKTWESILYDFILPFILGFVLSCLKVIADQRDVNWDEANGIALDLVLVSVIAFIVNYARYRSAHALLLTVTMDALVCGILLIIRSKRAKQRDRLLAHRLLVPPVKKWVGISEFALGATSIFWAVWSVQ